MVNSFADATRLISAWFPTVAPLAVACLVLVVFVWRYACQRRVQRGMRAAARVPREYDVVVVGASIAGPPLAINLARQGRKVLVVEDNLERPDRIVGELMQPGGMAALRAMGLEDCALSVGTKCTGYVAQFAGEWVQLPYENGLTSVSFHFGDFVMKLREKMQQWNSSEEAAKSAGSITVVEGNVSELVYDSATGTVVVGCRYRRKDNKQTVEATSHLVALCDGGYSKFRPTKKRLTPHSYFVGVILHGLKMPHETRGHVMLCRGGPVLSYRLDSGEVRILVDLPCRDKNAPPPEKLAHWLRTEVMPQLPADYKRCLGAELDRAEAGEKGIIRSHPHFHFTPLFPKSRGVVNLGDSGNQRHPLTGGGMTCALRDAMRLAEELGGIEYLGDSSSVHDAVLRFLRSRPSYTSVINVLSFALHGVFRGREEMKKACFAYFKLGGDCVTVPMAFLSAVNSSVGLLFYHYVRVALYGAIIVFSAGEFTAGSFLAGLLSPTRWITALTLLVDATRIFMPIMWVEFGAIGRLLDTTALMPSF